MKERYRTHKAVFLSVIVFIISLVVWSFGPIAQDPMYHRFADSKEMLGVPNALNVFSNLAFLVSSLIGCYFLYTGQGVFRNPGERTAYWVMFVSLGFVSVGSAYYHWSPTTGTLFWDRLPMTVTFMAIVSILFSEKVDQRLGQAMLVPLCIIGVASVSWWSFTEYHPDFAADLRFYILVQLAPVVLTPLVVFLYPDQYTHAHYMYICAFLYIASKLAELFDHGIYYLFLNSLSGHSLKHFLAAAGTTWIPFMINKRRVLNVRGM